MNVEPTFIKSSRARRVSIVIGSSREVVVKIPRGVSEEKAKQFAESKKGWIEKTLESFRKKEKKYEGALTLPKGNRRDFLKYKEEAARLVAEKLEEFNKVYGFRYGKVTIRNTRSRWGSCSKKGNLNFSYRIVLLPPALADYLVVHELCHLGEFNHSRTFWDLVAETMPNYRKLRKELRLIRSI